MHLIYLYVFIPSFARYINFIIILFILGIYFKAELSTFALLLLFLMLV